MIIATTFTVSWMPYQLTLIVIAYGNLGHALSILDSVTSLAFVSSCVNPIVYAFMWRPFRKSLIEVRATFFSHIFPLPPVSWLLTRTRNSDSHSDVFYLLLLHYVILRWVP